MGFDVSKRNEHKKCEMCKKEKEKKENVSSMTGNVGRDGSVLKQAAQRQNVKVNPDANGGK